jgi:phage baseplate assembly protein W
MRPDFGARLSDLVFAANGPTTWGLAVSQVRRALVEHEPRIDVLDVRAGADPADPARMLIDIDYQVRSTNSRFNLVFPFAVGAPA